MREFMEHANARWSELTDLASNTTNQKNNLAQRLTRFLSWIYKCDRGIAVATPRDIIHFFIFLDKNTTGNNVVHDTRCPGLAHEDPPSYVPPGCRCPRRLKYTTLKTYKKTLARVFTELGFSERWSPQTLCGNPVRSDEVALYRRLVEREQLRAHIDIKQAKLFDLSVFQALLDSIIVHIAACLQKSEWYKAFTAALDAFYFSILWYTGSRASDALGLLAQDFARSGPASTDAPSAESPDVAYGVFSLTFSVGKTRVKPSDSLLAHLKFDSSAYHPSYLWRVLVQAGLKLDLVLGEGPVFAHVTTQDTTPVSYAWGKPWKYKDVATKLATWLRTARLPKPVQSISPHSFHGSHAAHRVALGHAVDVVVADMAWSVESLRYYLNQPVIDNRGRTSTGVMDALARS